MLVVTVWSSNTRVACSDNYQHHTCSTSDRLLLSQWQLQAQIFGSVDAESMKMERYTVLQCARKSGTVMRLRTALL